MTKWSRVRSLFAPIFLNESLISAQGIRWPVHCLPFKPKEALEWGVRVKVKNHSCTSTQQLKLLRELVHENQ